MSEHDQMWEEIHDLEKRVGRLEDTNIEKISAAQAFAKGRDESRKQITKYVRLLTQVIAVVSTVLLTLTKLHLI